MPPRLVVAAIAVSIFTVACSDAPRSELVAPPSALGIAANDRVLAEITPVPGSVLDTRADVRVTNERSDVDSYLYFRAEGMERDGIIAYFKALLADWEQTTETIANVRSGVAFVRGTTELAISAEVIDNGGPTPPYPGYAIRVTTVP